MKYAVARPARLPSLVALVGSSFLLAACSATVRLPTNETPVAPGTADTNGAAVESLRPEMPPPPVDKGAGDSVRSDANTRSPSAVARPKAPARGPRSREHERVVRIARKYVGVPYRRGGSTPAGFDCSGFVRYVYAQVGVSLPHNAASQYLYGTPVDRDELEAGDLVFFDDLRHNGIYLGDGRFIHATRPGKPVTISTLDENWYADRWVGARRLPSASRTPAPAAR